MWTELLTLEKPFLAKKKLWQVIWINYFKISRKFHANKSGQKGWLGLARQWVSLKGQVGLLKFKIKNGYFKSFKFSPLIEWVLVCMIGHAIWFSDLNSYMLHCFDIDFRYSHLHWFHNGLLHSPGDKYTWKENENQKSFSLFLQP